MPEPEGPKKGLYLGLALVALATLMLQVALTRIFSVTMWYHMSLVSVSMAMFGMTLGALVVHWFPRHFEPEIATQRASLFSLLFALSTAGSLAACLNTPFSMEVSSRGLFRFLLWNSMAATPFVFSGVVVCICLTRFPRQVGRLYAFDLAGASLGCLAVVWLLDRVDAISAIVLVGAIPALAAAAFAQAEERKPLLVAGLVLGVLLGGLGFGNISAQWLKIRYVLGKPYELKDVELEKWNVFSYITVRNAEGSRVFWGGGANAPDPAELDPPRRSLQMDTRASSPILKFEGWDKLGWLMYDATNLIHALRSDGDVLVIGAGGGRDVLSALLPARGERKVEAVEINPITYSLHTDWYKDFTGIAKMKQVTLHNDEARSWVERTTNRYQIVTVPLVDTSAASAAGAFALTENGLYTVEAFKLFYSRLQDDGLVSVSRFWFGGSLGEAHRLVVTAAQALRELGIQEPRKHIYVTRGGRLANLMISKEPFTPQDLTTLREASLKYGFDELVSPDGGLEPELIAAAKDPDWWRKQSMGVIKIDISPCTDDRPYFFHSYSMSNLFSPASWTSQRQPGIGIWDREAMMVLAALVMGVTLLCLAVVVVPLWAEWGKKGGGATDQVAPTLGFFTLIGLGFMLFESAQMQRLSVFLGYPIYALSVVLFGLLLSSSLGASTVTRMWESGAKRTVPMACAGLLGTLLLTGLLTSMLQSWAAAAGTPVRILVSLALIAGPGFFLGMLFPLGLRLTEQAGQVSLAWCWAINGAASTCSAVYGIALSISMGIAFTYWTALGCYVLACLFCHRLTVMAADKEGS